MAVAERIVTPEEFDEFLTLPENADRDFEHISGRIVEVVSNNHSSEVGANFLGELRAFIKPRKLGRVTGADGGYWIGRERYIPDVAYVSFARQPEPCYDAYNPIAPDLAVEVLSPSNTGRELRRKIVNYLNAGTTVWLADPDAETIEVYMPGKEALLLRKGDTLDGGALLLGFTLAVNEVFDVGSPD
jgi:Uma2 family endonuclease